MDTVLGYGEEAKESQLQRQLFYSDSAEYFDFDYLVPSSTVNFGFSQRWMHTRDGNEVCVEGRLLHDLFDISSYLLNGVRLQIKVNPLSDAFRLMTASDENYEVKITECFLTICKLKVDSGIIVAHDMALNSNNAICNCLRCEFVTYSIAAGLYLFSADDMFLSKVPSILIVGLTSSQGFERDKTRNPFNFRKYELNYICFEVDGNPLPSPAFQPSYITNNYTHSCLS